MYRGALFRNSGSVVANFGGVIRSTDFCNCFGGRRGVVGSRVSLGFGAESWEE